jgi:hypothetical protein
MFYKKYIYNEQPLISFSRLDPIILLSILVGRTVLQYIFHRMSDSVGWLGHTRILA